MGMKIVLIIAASLISVLSLLAALDGVLTWFGTFYNISNLTVQVPLYTYSDIIIIIISASFCKYINLYINIENIELSVVSNDMVDGDIME